MGDRPKVVGLGGSLSARSSSRAALEVALEAAAEHGAETALFDGNVHSSRRGGSTRRPRRLTRSYDRLSSSGERMVHVKTCSSGLGPGCDVHSSELFSIPALVIEQLGMVECAGVVGW